MGNVIENPFLSDTYTTDRDIQKLAIEQYSLFLSKTKNKPLEVIEKELLLYFSNHKDKYKSVNAKVLIKDKNDDRQIKIVPLATLFKYVERKNYHFSPSMVAYTHSDEEECVNAIGTRQFIENRSYYKGLRQKAKSDGDRELYQKFDKLQNAFKIFNNAQSGAMSSEGTPLTNPSGHTSLTSTCRCLTSTANLINEQFIAGNRFYNTPENTLQSIVARVQVTDLKALQLVMDKYELYYPTSDDVLEVVKQCSYRYWESKKSMEIINDFLKGLEPLQLASILYTLDLVSLFRHNEKFAIDFFDQWVEINDKEKDLKPDNGDKYVLCISKLPKGSDKEAINKLNGYHDKVEKKYSDFINVFFKSIIPPTGLFDVTSSIRDCVLTSDTDSSIYTVDKMVDCYTTDKVKAIRLNAVLTYFIRMISVDQHQQLSANMNVSLRNLRMLNMKNEYYFGAYVTTLMSKHYYASQRMVEGVMNDEPEMEIKGVHLRSSKISHLIKDESQALMKEAIFALEDGRKLNPAEQLKKIADLERQVIKEINDGEWHWLSKQTIKGEKSYSNPDSSVYYYHRLWETVFANKYGPAPELPYLGIKINVDLGSKSKFKNYVSLIEDKELAKRLLDFSELTGRSDFDSIVVPMERLQSMNNIPDELKQVIDFRSVIKQNFKSTYAVLESTGLYFINDKITRLVSDEH